MLDKTTLSKQKYIYCVYADKKDMVHTEHFPVIYINSHYVYFKVPGDDALVLRSIFNIKDSLCSLNEYEIDNLRYTKQYFWAMDEDIPKTLKDITEKYNQNIIEQKKKKAKQDLDYAKRLYDKTLEVYKKYEEI